MSQIFSLKGHSGKTYNFLALPIEPLRDSKNAIYIIIKESDESDVPIILFIGHSDSVLNDIKAEKKLDYFLKQGAQFIGIYTPRDNMKRKEEYLDILKGFDQYPPGNREFEYLF